MSIDDFNAIAWNAFVAYAWGEPSLRAQFTEQTGVGTTVTDSDVAARFVEWVTREHWGLEDAPRAYQDFLHAKGA